MERKFFPIKMKWNQLQIISALKIKNKFYTHWLTVAGILFGALAGYLYYYFVGCKSGTCLITSKPLNSTLYGAMMGGLLFSIFKKETKKNSNDTNDKKYIGDGY